jgi:hypothetical protein
MPSISDFVFLNSDSIVLASSNEQKIYLYSRTKGILKRHIFSQLQEDGTYGQQVMFVYPAYAPMHVGNGGQLVFNIYNQYMPQEKEYYQQGQMLYTFNIFTGEGYAFGAFPQSYQSDKDCPCDYEVGLGIEGDKTWASFRKSHFVHTYINGQQQAAFCMKSNYIAQMPLLPYHVEGDPANEYFRAEPRYVGIYLQPDKQRVYRVAKHAQPSKNVEGMKNEFLQAKWSLIVANTDGNIIGEAVFPEKKYDFWKIHPVKAGLLISRDNKFSDENKEEMIEFDLIDFQ